MNCENYMNLLPDLVENKLDKPTAERVTSHLVSCSDCETEFETLFDGKEIYTNFLCEIEPPNNLSAKFRAKLEIEERKPIPTAASSLGFYQRLSKSFAFLRLNAALTTAAILILFALGFSVFNFVGNWKFAENPRLSPAISENSPLISPPRRETGTKKFAPATASGEPKKSEIADLKKEVGKEMPKFISVNRSTVKKIEPKRAIPSEIIIKLSSEEQNQIAQIQGVGIDAARQIEKVELLFRAFRNARSIEETGLYDVAYEKQQARKLLRNNVELKQRAESYGTLLTEEMLNKVEPYLLDIANLDSNASVEQVAKIKDRFRTQNIIAELQGF